MVPDNPPPLHVVSWASRTPPLVHYTSPLSVTNYRIGPARPVYSWMRSGCTTAFFGSPILPGDSVVAKLRIVQPPFPQHLLPQAKPEDISNAAPTAVGVQLFPFPENMKDKPSPTLACSPISKENLADSEAYPLGLTTHSAAVLLNQNKLANGTTYSHCILPSETDLFQDDAKQKLKYSIVTVSVQCVEIGPLIQEYQRRVNTPQKRKFASDLLAQRPSQGQRTHQLFVQFTINEKPAQQQFFSDVYPARIGVCCHFAACILHDLPSSFSLKYIPSRSHSVDPLFNVNS